MIQSLVLATLAGLAVSQSDINLSAISMRECTADQAQTICTCDTNMRPLPTPPTVTRNVAYITMINGDDGLDGEYSFLVKYVTSLLTNFKSEIELRFVHRPLNLFLVSNKNATPMQAGYEQPKCVEDASGYEVSVMDVSIVNDLRNGKESSFLTFFNRIYKDGTYKCDAYAMQALYQDLAAYKASFDGDVIATKLTLQPFSDDESEYNGATFTAIESACSNEDFVDSALIITDADFVIPKSLWSSSLNEQPTRMMSCALSAPQITTGCEDYKVLNQPENKLTRIGRERQHCPMIPNWEKRNNKPQMNNFGKAIGELHAKTISSTITSRGPRPDAPDTTEMPIMINELPKNRTMPEDIICSYDVLIAVDLECIDFNENPVVVSFTKQLIKDVFAAAERGQFCLSFSEVSNFKFKNSKFKNFQLPKF